MPVAMRPPAPSQPLHALHGLHDIFEVVLNYLEAQDVALCRLVCREWHALVRALLWRLAPAAAADAAAVAVCFPALTTLTLSLPAAAHQGRLAPLASLHRLRRLELVPAAGAAAAAPLELDLRTLLPLVALPHLQSLALQGWRLQSCTALQHLGSLTELELGACTLEDWQGTLAPLLAPLSRLVRLRCGGQLPRAGREPLAGLGTLGALADVALADGAPADDDACAELAALRRLSSLELSRCHKDANSPDAVTDAGLAALACLGSGLRRLALAGHGGLTDAGLALLARALTALQHLELRLQPWAARPPPLPGVGDDGVRSLASCLRGLRSLRLGWLRLGERGCEAIAGLAGLTCLELHCCPELRDAALLHLRRLPALARLGLRGCTGVTDIGLAQLARGAAFAPALRELDLGGCHKNVSDAGLAALGGLRLEVLGLAHCDAVTDAGIERLLCAAAGGGGGGDGGTGSRPSAVAASLRALDCRDCSRLTDRAAALLAARASALHWLCLEHCGGVGDEGLRRLASGLPSLARLQLFGSGVSSRAVEALLEGQAARARGRRLRIDMHKPAWWVPPSPSS